VVRVRYADEGLDFVLRRGEYASRRNKNPDLMLLDLNLPNVEGITVLRALRTEERTQTIPVVVLTQSEQESKIVESYRLGIRGYLVKPVTFPAFAGLVAQAGFRWGLLGKHPPDRTSSLSRWPD
jgi:CheY-like chemotaxis protein